MTNLYLKQPQFSASGSSVVSAVALLPGGSNGVGSSVSSAGVVVPSSISESTGVFSNASESMTLSKIVESFLMHQHAQCPYPVSVCPRFSLHHPHRCPEPRPDTWAGPVSDVPRLVFARESLVGCQRLRCSSRKFIRRFVHSRFTPAFSVRNLDDELPSAVAFSVRFEIR